MKDLLKHRYTKPILAILVLGIAAVILATTLTTKSTEKDTNSIPKSDSNEATLSPAAPIVTSTEILLDIPWREQPYDATNLGYCGETALSMMGQYFGMWIAPEVARTMSNVDQLTIVLPADDSHGKKLVQQMNDLRLTYSFWDYNKEATPQIQSYLLWVKQSLAQFQPVFVVSYACDTESPNGDYDHIMPAVGISSSSLNDFSTYRGDDKLSIHSLLKGMNPTSRKTQCITQDQGKIATRTFSLWQGNKSTTNERGSRGRGKRDNTNLAFSTGGSIPITRDYGMAVHGVSDPKKIAFYSRLVLNPLVPSIKDLTAPITGTLKMFLNTSKSTSYSIIRYNEPTDCPSAASKADDYLTAENEYACSFTATANTMQYIDAKSIDYKTIYIYRVISNKDVIDSSLVPQPCNGEFKVLPDSNFCGTSDPNNCPFSK